MRRARRPLAACIPLTPSPLLYRGVGVRGARGYAEGLSNLMPYSSSEQASLLAADTISSALSSTCVNRRFSYHFVLEPAILITALIMNSSLVIVFFLFLIWCFFTTRFIKRQCLCCVIRQLLQPVVVVFLLVTFVDDAFFGSNVNEVASAPATNTPA